MCRCLEAIGSDDLNAGPTEDDLTKVRRTFADEYDMRDTNNTEAMDTKLQAQLLWKMAREFGDPDADTIYEWLSEGAPAGITMDIDDPGHVFPPEDNPNRAMELGSLPDYQLHTNYTSVDGDEAAGPEVERLIQTGFVKAFDTHQLLQEWVGRRQAVPIQTWDDHQGERGQSQTAPHSRLQGKWRQQQSQMWLPIDATTNL